VKRTLLVLAAALAGCTTIGHERVEGWPELVVTEYRVPAAQMRERCRKYVGFLQVPLACAEFNLAAKRCVIWLDAGYAPAWVVEHERLHCQGFDHVGSTAMRDFLVRWRAAQ
jgi:hypothetical protein